MFNRSPYNRTPYNRSSLLEFQWMATVSGVAETKASITLSLILSASAVSGQTEATASMVLLVLPSARITTAIAESIGTYIRTIFYSALATARADAKGSKVSIYEIVKIVIDSVNMAAGDILVVDTEHMTVTLNGVNIVDKISDTSAFFDLKPGLNEITASGDAPADIKVLWKDRWL